MADKLGLTAGDALLTIHTVVDDEKDEFIEFAKAAIDPARFNLITDVEVDDWCVLAIIDWLNDNFDLIIRVDWVTLWINSFYT